MAVLDNLLLDKTAQHYLTACQAEGKSKKTVESYELNLRHFSTFMPSGTKLLEVTPQNIREFMVTVMDQSDNRAHQHYRVLHSFFAWCTQEGFLDSSPMKNIKAPAVGDIVIETFTADHIKTLLDACPPPRSFLGARNRAMVLMFLDSGIRALELTLLQLSDMDIKTGLFKVRGKGRKERILRISAKPRTALLKYLLLREMRVRPTENTLFLSEEARPLTRNAVTGIIEKLGQSAGITSVRCSPHTFRHTFSINFLRAGGNIFELQILLGHSSLEMVKRYSRTLNTDDALRAHERFSPVDWMLK
ncbi:MAG: tyrosine-type recombinase/integrase [Dehalococcoidales bacterium]|nr:tyrosine-type recombinase/integrase [Dehalococcoidales bacterium]